MEILSEGQFIRISGPGAIDRILLNRLAAFKNNMLCVYRVRYNGILRLLKRWPKTLTMNANETTA
jgi:hypothetical protein